MQAIRVFEASNLAHLETCAHLINEAIIREQLRPDEHLVLKGKLEEQQDIRRQVSLLSHIAIHRLRRDYRRCNG